MTFNLACLPDTGGVDNAFFPGISQAFVRKAPEAFYRTFQPRLLRIGGCHDEVSLLAISAYLGTVRSISVFICPSMV